MYMVSHKNMKAINKTWRIMRDTFACHPARPGHHWSPTAPPDAKATWPVRNPRSSAAARRCCRSCRRWLAGDPLGPAPAPGLPAVDSVSLPEVLPVPQLSSSFPADEPFHGDAAEATAGAAAGRPGAGAGAGIGAGAGAG